MLAQTAVSIKTGRTSVYKDCYSACQASKESERELLKVQSETANDIGEAKDYCLLCGHGLSYASQPDRFHF
jgi:hypothetical protein